MWCDSALTYLIYLYSSFFILFSEKKFGHNSSNILHKKGIIGYCSINKYKFARLVFDNYYDGMSLSLSSSLFFTSLRKYRSRNILKSFKNIWFSHIFRTWWLSWAALSSPNVQLTQGRNFSLYAIYSLMHVSAYKVSDFSLQTSTIY